MATLSRGFRVFSLLTITGLVGCGLLAKKAGDAPDADVAEAAAVEVAAEAAAPVPVVALPTAKNENDISRFPDEQKLENVSATLLRQANVREVPGTGKLVTTIAKGTAVTQIAQRSTFFLVMFQNPDATTSMGWIPADSFTAPPVVEAGVVAIKCVLPETALISDTPFCGKICGADTDCPSGQACKGAANKLAGTSGKGDAVNVCIVFGQPRAAVDASAPAAPAPAAPAPAVPGGGGLVSPMKRLTPVPVPSVDIADPVGGACAVGFALVAKDNKCHKTCVIGGCRGTNKCAPCAGANVCATSVDFCK